VLSKFLHLGLSLDEVLARVTSVPAATVLMQDRIGTLAPGAWGDAVVLDLRQGSYNLADSYGAQRTGTQSLEPVTVIKAGKVYHA